MKKSIFTYLVLSLSILFAGNTLSVNFVKAKQSASSGIVTLNIKNTSNQSIKVLKWNTILENTISANIFQIKNAKVTVSYTGRLIKRMSPTENDYTTFTAYEERTIDVSLSNYYDMHEKGTYQVSYTANFQILGAKQKPDTSKASKVLPTQITIDFIPSQKKSAPAQKVAANFNQCSQSEITTLNAAHDAAIVMAQDAYNTMNNAEQNTSGERYTTWFGAADATRQSTVTSNFNKIYTALDTKNILFDCNCTGTHIAHVYPTDPYKVYLCPAFWNLPAVGTDSRAGTVVHEVSHFQIVAGTDDHVYGHSGAKALANSNPTQAINNADSHEFFAENTPSLTMDDPFATAQVFTNILTDLPITESIDAAGDKGIFQFTVLTTGRYTFHTTGRLDTQGTLYDENRVSLAYHDDINETSNRNFQISHLLVKGKTYYIKVNAYASDVGGYDLNSAFRPTVNNDFNADGIADILWRNTTTGQYLTFFMNADGSRKGYKYGYTIPTTWTIADTNDFDGDGIADILWRHTGGQYLTFFMNADGSRKGYKYGSTISTEWEIQD